MINGFFSKFELSDVQRLSCGIPEFNDGFAKSRICVGQQETDSFDQKW
jgi:hypothetical protein